MQFSAPAQPSAPQILATPETQTKKCSHAAAHVAPTLLTDLLPKSQADVSAGPKMVSPSHHAERIRIQTSSPESVKPCPNFSPVGTPAHQMIPFHADRGSPKLTLVQDFNSEMESQWLTRSRRNSSATSGESPLSSVGPEDGEISDDEDALQIAPVPNELQACSPGPESWDVRAKASRGKFKGLRGQGLLGIQICSPPEGKGFQAGRGCPRVAVA
jgi:hypothetical protein